MGDPKLEALQKENADLKAANEKAAKGMADLLAKKPSGAVDEQLAKILAAEAAKLVKDNEPDILILTEKYGEKMGEKIARAVLAQKVVNSMPALFVIPANASAEIVNVLQGIATERSRIFHAIQKAESEESARIARIRGNASIAAGNIAKAIVGVGATVVIKGLLGV